MTSHTCSRRSRSGCTKRTRTPLEVSCAIPAHSLTSLTPALDKPPYIVTETGWGEFTVGIRIQFVPEANEKPITLQHPIKLHHWGAPVEPSVSAIGGPTPSAPASAAPTPAASAPVEPASATETKKDADGDVKMEVDTPGGADAQPTEPAAPPTASADVAGGSETEGEVITAVRPNAAGDASRTETSTPAPVSIAAKMPVHAWQYDELIFYDPPLIFYNILNDHPPTPLPARNRRPRDQREVHTQKKKKGRVSAVASSSRANTPARTESGSVPPATAVPAAGESVGVGIPGEPGSADVPLEFTAEMEKGEWNRLHDARKKIIDEMDRWR